MRKKSLLILCVLISRLSCAMSCRAVTFPFQKDESKQASKQASKQTFGLVWSCSGIEEGLSGRGGGSGIQLELLGEEYGRVRSVWGGGAYS